MVIPIERLAEHRPAGPDHLFGAIFTASPDVIVVVDAQGAIVLSNPAVMPLFGYYPEEIVGEPIEFLIPEDRRPSRDDHLRGFFASPRARQMMVVPELLGVARDGEVFAVDVSLVPVKVLDTSYVAAFVRDARERQRGVDRLHAVNDITQRLLTGIPVGEVLPLVAQRARSLSGAAASWVVTPASSGRLVISAADGPGTEALVGVELSENASRSAHVLMTGRPDIVEDFALAPNVPDVARGLGLGPGVYLPLIAEQRRLGTLVLARSSGAPPFDSLDVALAEVFAGATAVAIELGQTRAALDRLALVEEDERIARDLHDTVIQQLFGIGMSLQATRNTATGVTVGRIDSAVAELDEVIRDIRNTIFRLPDRAAATRDLRDEMFRVADRWREDLGFMPRIGLHGSVDVVVSEVIVEQLLRVLSEALSNVARYAKASLVEAVISIEDGSVSLLVSDDGVGISSGPFAGQGLRNMSTRAADLGGNFEARRREPSGTVLEWRVPL